jgi:PAS domain S-box-containing protein
LADTIITRAGASVDEAKLLDEQLRVLFRTSLIVLVNVFNSVLLSIVIWGALPNEMIVGWDVLVVLVTGGRLIVRQRYLVNPAACSARTWLQLAMWGAAASGALWGIAALTIPIVDDPILHMLVGLIVVGTTAAAMVSLYVHPQGFLAFALPALGPTMAACFAHGGAAYISLALMTAIYGIALSYAGRVFATSFRRTVALQLDLEQVNADLESRVDERTRSLHERERQLRLLADSLPVLITYLDAELRFRFVNRTGETWYQRPLTEIIGKPIYEIVRPAHDRTLKPFRDRAFDGTPTETEQYITYPDGEERWVDVRFIPDFADDRSVRGIYTVSVDITGRKRMETQLAQAQKMEAIGQLTGGVAHDFNNLLGIIVGNLDLLIGAAADRPQDRSYAEHAKAAARRGAELTQRLLAFGRRQTLQPRAVDANALILEMSTLLDRTLGEQVRVTLKLADGLWPCLVDPGQLENAILNLAINARDAMPSGGMLRIETANRHLGGYVKGAAEFITGDHVHIIVADSGVGMDEYVAARAFDPFFTTKGDGKGTGLGLSMVYGFVKQSGGHAVIESQPGHGTSVHLYFPRGTGQAEMRPASASPVASGTSSAGKLILVVEDNPGIQLVALTILGLLGCKTLVATTAQEALDLIAANANIDLLFADISLPGGKNGVELAAEAVAKRPGLRVLFTSGFAQSGFDAAGGAAVKADILPKPYEKEDLVRALDAVFSKQP